MKEKIQELAQNYYQEIVDIRRHLHQHPELSFQENETAVYIASILDKWGLVYQKGIAGNGIVAILEGKNPQKKTIALRADIDALPVEEQNNVPYKSINKGVMHACGHDAHTSSLLGVIRILSKLKNELEGTIKFIFQPAEENYRVGRSK